MYVMLAVELIHLDVWGLPPSYLMSDSLTMLFLLMISVSSHGYIY